MSAVTSPWLFQVDDHKVACAGKVRVGGAGLKNAEANKKNAIELDLSEAGKKLASRSIALKEPSLQRSTTHSSH